MPISVASPPEIRGLARPVRALVRLALALEGLRPGEIAVVMTRDAALRALNRRFRAPDRTTDVLSFAYPAPTPRASGRGARTAPPVSGDLVISLDRVRVQARRYRVSRGRETARLVLHGTLHLAGLDHGTAPERMRMRRKEARALRQAAAHVAEIDRALDAAG